jgi:hypothetical protein
MFSGQTQKWMRFLERRFGWIAIPNLAIILVTLQALGFLCVMSDPVWIGHLALVPELVKAGEYYRLITFLALPLSTSPLWVIFTLWFLYFVVNMIENEWGAFKTTFYVLISIVLMITFSFVFDYPITQIAGFESTLFLASAALFPEMEVQLFMIIPVKMKYLAWLTLGLLVFHFLSDSWIDRLYLIAMYANYFLFFGPAQISRLKQIYRKWDFDRRMRR